MRNPDPYNSERVTLRHDGRDRTFIVVTPDELPAGAPALLYFHGSLQNGNVARNFTGLIFDRMAAERGVVLVYPDGVDRHFNDARRQLNEKTRQLGVDDVSFTRALVDWLLGERGVNASLVFACGFSNGGQMVLRLLLDAPSLLAGAATFAATLPVEDNRILDLGSDPVPTPFLAIHGTADHIVKYDGGLAGLDAAHTRGELLSARDTVDYFAGVNGFTDADRVELHPVDGVTVDRWEREDLPPVEFWTIEGMGHLVPTPKELPASVGPGTSAVVASEVVADFFGF